MCKIIHEYIKELVVCLKYYNTNTWISIIMFLFQSQCFKLQLMK
jgi:hypothetical protein